MVNKTREFLESALIENDEHANSNESKASFLKRLEITTAIERAIHLCDAYEAWAERVDANVS